MSELKDRIKNDTDMSNTEVNAANNVYRGDLEMAVFNARKRIEVIDGDTHTDEEYNEFALIRIKQKTTHAHQHEV